jgi:hypothetical protein
MRRLSTSFPLSGLSFRFVLAASAVGFIAFTSRTPLYAQDLTPANQPALTDASPEKEGLVQEPDPVRRAVVIFDRRFNFGEVDSGPYAVVGKMIPGAGWISAGPGYRRWYAKDHVFVDASAEVSWHAYKTVQGRFELPRLADGKLLAGSQVRWQDFTQVAYFGEGPSSVRSDQSRYAIQSKIFGGYATFRPQRTLALDFEAGWLRPTIGQPGGSFQSGAPDTRALFSADPVYALRDQPTFFNRAVSVTWDTRDYPGHPTAGSVYRAAMTNFSDRGVGMFNFSLYEAEAARFTPVGAAGAVLILHGWAMGSDVASDQAVPFYLQPSLGGLNTLRGYTDYRFHDRDLLLFNVEARIPLMTHVDGAAFADFGNVASRFRDLDLRKNSYGGGLRLHSRRQTLVRLDVARSREGWMCLLRLSDPFGLTRLSRQTATAPFVP